MLKLITSSLIACIVLLPLHVAAENPDDSWTNVFKFQSRMAKLGNVRAQYFLAEMYEEGRGVTQSSEKAVKWYEKAQRGGHQDAAIRITQIKLRIANKKLTQKKAKLKVKPKAKAKAKAKKKVRVKLIPAKKFPTSKKVNQDKVTVQPKSKIIATKEPIKQLPVTKPVTKPKRANASPNALNRGIGTHFDDTEDPFE